MKNILASLTPIILDLKIIKEFKQTFITPFTFYLMGIGGDSQHTSKVAKNSFEEDQ